jgi:nicotinamide mononucleotide transporter
MLFVEAVAALLIIVNVALVAVRSIWNYAFGIAGVLVYAWVFYDARLYSDALLQGFFLAAQFYGWWHWSRSRAGAGEIVVSRLSNRARLGWAAGIAVAAAAWGMLMHRYTDAAVPWLDASVAMTSIAAQVLMSRQKIENWWLWMIVNTLSVVMYAWRGLWPTLVLYAVLLGLTVLGLVKWQSAARSRAAA